MALSWTEQLEKQLIATFGKQQGKTLSQKYLAVFPASYKDETDVEVALLDIEAMEQLSPETPIKLNFNIAPKREQPLHLRLYQWNKLIPLSDILPILENLDLNTYKEHPFRIAINDGKDFIWLSDYSLSYKKLQFDLHKTQQLFQEAFVHIYQGTSENDGFNKLILGALLSWREITIIRTYTKYLKQIGFRFSQAYIEKTVANHIDITAELIHLFKTLHDPNLKKDKAKTVAEEIEQRIISKLETVVSLDEDRIIRKLLELIKCTLRTNYFQTTTDGKTKPYLAIKLDSRNISDLPLPTPLYEIFVYSPRFEAIHLRNTKVARGGIRWSDRLEDFRTEILGLMKAQKVKNALIVPSGAKGGFVLKASPLPSTRELLIAEVIHCYTLFISGLLDLTDNIVKDKIIPPKQVVCHDDTDTYLVVAADKGTATFSDIANAISKAYKFWLGDAFASGGSTGYDHKKIGITARGAWESIKRHFHELNIDALSLPITVVGIGDMSGDVFGNGMIYTNNIKLVAAFDHRHIFLDPDPDPAIAYAERLRLFKLPASSWEDYNSKLISKGGGVFKRSAKSIALSTQIKKVLGTDETTLTPNDLIKTILKAPVDLLFNGGIGTYVKASLETNAEVSDRTNDYCRVNGEELRCKVVGEGGNLGFTQLGRVEYALTGGLINTDFIDNSGGVDCSDHEVNLKILLNPLIENKNLTEKKRNDLLASLTNEVADLVLADNYKQALVMSFSALRAQKYVGLYASYIKELETLGVLNRKVEFLPDDKKILERKAAGLALTRPEIAILLAYTKIHIKNEILESDLPEDEFLNDFVAAAFPKSIAKKYGNMMLTHRLHREIIATELSNAVVNEMGITFVYRQQMETNATIPEIVRAYVVASQIYETAALQQLVASLDFKISIHAQYDMLYSLRTLINLATRWFLHDNRINSDLEKIINHYAPLIKKLTPLIPTLMGGYIKAYLENLIREFTEKGLPKSSAERIATCRALYTALNIIEVSTQNKFDLSLTAKVYFAAGEKVNLLWFRDHIANDTREGHWNTVARLTLRDELDVAQRALTFAVLKNNGKEKDPNRLIDNWLAKNKQAMQRWDRLLTMLHSASDIDYTMLFIAMRELIGYIVNGD